MSIAIDSSMLTSKLFILCDAPNSCYTYTIDHIVFTIIEASNPYTQLTQ